jgi:hypothetical protein
MSRVRREALQGFDVDRHRRSVERDVRRNVRRIPRFTANPDANQPLR